MTEKDLEAAASVLFQARRILDRLNALEQLDMDDPDTAVFDALGPMVPKDQWVNLREQAIDVAKARLSAIGVSDALSKVSGG